MSAIAMLRQRFACGSMIPTQGPRSRTSQSPKCSAQIVSNPLCQRPQTSFWNSNTCSSSSGLGLEGGLSHVLNSNLSRWPIGRVFQYVAFHGCRISHFSVPSSGTGNPALILDPDSLHTSTKRRSAPVKVHSLPCSPTLLRRNLLQSGQAKRSHISPPSLESL